MRNQLIQYVDLLFAGAGNCQQVRQVTMQNALNRYDDLVSSGKSPEEAYRLTITGIGDINALLEKHSYNTCSAVPAVRDSAAVRTGSELRKSVSGLVWAIGLALYFIISFATMAWHVTWVIFLILGALDGLLGVLISTRDSGIHRESRLSKSIGGLVWAIGLALYFLISFATFAWHITWLIFPITGAVQGLVRAIFDLKEAYLNEE